MTDSTQPPDNKAEDSRPTALNSLGRLAADGRGADEEKILEQFLGWTEQVGLELYPAQEEAILELTSGHHVILNTPTGSGKSLVALALHFKALCEGKRSFYTSPIKALASEKFFDLCEQLGAENVGMLTGDASINPRAPVICCTAEILSNMALRRGRYTEIDYVIIDEFHYFGDRDRGVAWQIPLLELRDATFLLMSATLGDMREIAGAVEQLTNREVAIVRSRDRPVPLDYSYLDSPLHRTIKELVEQGKAPIYLVNFTQRDAAEQAQNATSLNVTTKEEKSSITKALRGFRFDTPYGKEIRRFIKSGIGVHHAGLLPKYRLLVEQLAQQGLLKIISGTDTLGVGVNVPIRTVLFTKLCKFDGEKVRLLTVRDFHQIAGRAGRKGFDERGSVVCQAPEHVVENKQAEAKAKTKKGRQPKKKPSKRGYVHYDAATFKKLITSDPERLIPQFQISHGLMMNMLEREVEHGRRDGGYKRLVQLIEKSFSSETMTSRHRRTAATLLRALRSAGIVELVRADDSKRVTLRVRDDLQSDFSLHQSLSLYLLETLPLLDAETESYPFDVVTLVEAIMEDPRVVLLKQEDKAKGDAVAEMKSRGVEYEERMEALEKISHPKPNADFIYNTFDTFRETRPWLRHENVRPKSIVGDMYDRYASFHQYVKELGLQRSEGVLLRYLTQTYKALLQTVPDSFKDETIYDLLAYLRTMLAHVDSSLIKEWESLLDSKEEVPIEASPAFRAPSITRDPRAFLGRVRAELHRLVKALADRAYDDATASVWQPSGGEANDEAWPAERFEQAMKPFYKEHESLIFDHRARFSDMTRMKKVGELIWHVEQSLLDPEETKIWFVEAVIDLGEPESVNGPLLRVQRIAS